MLSKLFDVDMIPEDGEIEGLPFDMRAAGEDHSHQAEGFRNEIHILLRQINELQAQVWALKDKYEGDCDD